MPSGRLSKAGLVASMCSLLSLSHAQQLSFPDIQPSYDVWGEMDNALQANLVPAGLTLSQWAPGWVPISCYSDDWMGLDPRDYTVYNVTYSDCSEPFVICRHKDTTAHIGMIITEIAKIPARWRQWVGNFVAIPTVRPQNSGWHRRGTVVLQDDYWRYPGLLVHEVAHAVDFLKLGNAWDTNYSMMRPWQELVEADGVVATDYARWDWLESFAEIARIYAYDVHVPGGLASLPPPVEQLANQLGAFDQLLKDDYNPALQCNGKVASTPAFPIESARGSSRLQAGERPNLAITTVPEIVIPEGASNEATNCKVHI